MNTILNAARAAATKPLDEQNYLFLKRLCQVLTSLGSQLSALWVRLLYFRDNALYTMHLHIPFLTAELQANSCSGSHVFNL